MVTFDLSYDDSKTEEDIIDLIPKKRKLTTEHYRLDPRNGDIFWFNGEEWVRIDNVNF